MDTMRMGNAQFDILGQELKKLADEQARDLDGIFYPNGREAAYARLSAMCDLSPAALGFGPISREPNPWWKTRKS